jgi:hypothetical protein
MVLNFITLNRTAFLPGLCWVKNTLPLFAMYNIRLVIKSTGNKINRADRAIQKSMALLKKD